LPYALCLAPTPLGDPLSLIPVTPHHHPPYVVLLQLARVSVLAGAVSRGLVVRAGAKPLAPSAWRVAGPGTVRHMGVMDRLRETLATQKDKKVSEKRCE
jgi:hypothetical protein